LNNFVCKLLLKLTFSLLVISAAFGSETSFFLVELECIGVKRFLSFSRKLLHEYAPKVFESLGEKTYLSQPAVKTLHRAVEFDSLCCS